MSEWGWYTNKIFVFKVDCCSTKELLATEMENEKETRLGASRYATATELTLHVLNVFPPFVYFVD